MSAAGKVFSEYGYEGASMRMIAKESGISDSELDAIRQEAVKQIEAAWLGSLPGQAYANIRQPIVHTLNLAHMCPLSAVWAGPERCEHLDGPPLLCQCRHEQRDESRGVRRGARRDTPPNRYSRPPRPCRAQQCGRFA